MVASASSFLPSEGVTLLKSTVLTGTGVHAFDARTKWIKLFLVAGGGGGGGGGSIVHTAPSASSSPVISGNGGAGGEVLVWEGSSSAFGESASFACGAGGNGGAGRVKTASSDSGDGTNFVGGSAGGDTVFGGLKVRGGGGGGAGSSSVGGSVSAGAVPRSEAYVLDRSGLQTSPTYVGGQRASDTTSPGFQSPVISNTVVNGLFGAGGGAGGTWRQSNLSIHNGGDGGGGSFGFAVGGVSSLSANGTAGDSALAFSPLAMQPGGGGGGGGASGHRYNAAGGLVGSRTGGNGGNGWFGGGGGGGGAAAACTTGASVTATGGAGGNGGNGGIAVFEFG